MGQSNIGTPATVTWSLIPDGTEQWRLPFPDEFLQSAALRISRACTHRLAVSLLL